jgi:hypothetical protein
LLHHGSIRAVCATLRIAHQKISMHIETGHSITKDEKVLAGIKSVRFVVGDQTVFEVSVGKDEKSIEIRSAGYVAIDGVVYDPLEMSVKPVAANCVKMSLLPFES